MDDKNKQDQNTENSAENASGNTAEDTCSAGGEDCGTAGNAGEEDGASRAEKSRKKAGKKTEPAVRPGEELVPIRLFRDNDKYKDDVFVAVNGERIQIKRGETVLVKKKFADVLEQSMQQDMATASLIDRESSQYAEEAKARGL